MTNRRWGVYLAISGFLIFGCGTSEIDPVIPNISQTVQSGDVVSAASAQTFIDNVFIPVDLDVFIPCANHGAGETVELSGILHSMFRVTINGNKIGIKVHDQPQGIRGVGQVTGERYRATGVTQELLNERLQGFPFKETYINNFRIIGRRSGNNYLVHETIQFTVNANGQVTSDVVNIRVSCK